MARAEREDTGGEQGEGTEARQAEPRWAADQGSERGEGEGNDGGHDEPRRDAMATRRVARRRTLSLYASVRGQGAGGGV